MSKEAEKEAGNLERDAKYSSVQALERNSDDMLNRSQVGNKTPSNPPEDLQSLELTLTKPRETGDQKVNVLKQSNHSAFSK